VSDRPPEFRSDGSLHSGRYDDVYFQAEGLAEARHVFVAGNELGPRFARARRFTVAETGFGTGLNFCATWRLFRELAPAEARLCFVSVEAEPLPAPTLCRALAGFPEIAGEAEALAAGWDAAARGFVRRSFDGGRVLLCLLLGEVGSVLPAHRFRADAWFLDGFAPARNPAMWNDAVLAEVARHTRPGGTFATYTVAGAVRRGLERQGFRLERRPGFGRKRQMLCGTLIEPRPDPTPAWLALPDPAPLRAITVVGAGLAGAGAARALAERGVEVRVVDRVGIAAGASGHDLAALQPRLGDEPDARFVARAFDWTRSWLQTAAPETFVGCGALHPALDAAGERRLRDRLERGQRAGVRATWLDPAACDTRAGLPLGSRGGVWIADAAVVRPRLLCARLLDHPRIELCRGEARGVEGPRILAHALGARELDAELPMRAARGQLSLLAAAPGEPPRTLICEGGYLSPAVDGRRAVGATYALGDEDPAPRDADHAQNLARFRERFAGLEAALAEPFLGAACGIRATTPDHLPYVGPLPDREACIAAYAAAWRGARIAALPPPALQDGIAVSVGHGSRGVATGPFAGELIAAMLCGEPLPLEEDLLRRLLPIRGLVRRVQRGPRSAER
jgi:tRNA 5-methylaminomethyl-2-thiouridine biosynthesis bifunctional protein